jgi:pimeloyl-ACP methyl ester carboxylesterase
MASAVIDGISTRYETIGSGPPLLMFAPGGFNATVEKWRTSGVYARTNILDRLAEAFTCIVFDRRECGQSGGRVERLTWNHFVAQGKGLLDHLGIARAHIMGGCMGCSLVMAMAVAHPQTVAGMVLYWPVGGAKYRLRAHLRFARHLAFVDEQGLDAVVELAKSSDKTFADDQRVGPWGSVIRNDAAFAAAFARQDIERYKLIVAGMSRGLFDRDTAPGAEPEDLLRLDVPALVVPGNDDAHATSAARYVAECLPQAEYWDIAVDDQTEVTVPDRVVAFLGGVGVPAA